ncbi:DUF6115 domain-containing protein [Desulfobacula toluolica]|uniref:Conserved uncharacterized protein, associated with flagellar apparatus genes n=1 Tax=Desulfobacula toluolica (strain DSM 7467 / Tol2) TaxID=651182 RepID=K0NLW5_DESTT|nr:hypothetical protein [Desulfobacula toluolica]CCK81720.1 conserved uncharacterized protein, associated with flagellar apparatus genes [Desulfobacula toluolica Tol2]
MMELFSIEFWITILFFVNFFLAIFLFVFVKKINRLNLAGPDTSHQDDGQEGAKIAFGSAADIIEMLEPLVEESRKAAISFDQQIKEKKRLVKELNNALDARVISINRSLSRADALQKKMEKNIPAFKPSSPLPNTINFNTSSNATIDHQHRIIEMYNQQFDIDSIAQQLSIPKGEVQLVIELKKKFIEMEKNSR